MGVRFGRGSVMKTAHRMASPGGANGIFKALMEGVSDAVFIIEPQRLGCLEVNKKGAILLGYSESEFLDLKANQVFSLSADYFQQLALKHGEFLTEGARLLTRDGQSCYVNLISYAVEYQGRGAILVIIRDRPGGSGGGCHPCKMSGNAEDREDLIETTLDFPTLIGQSRQIRDVCRLIGLVAQTDTTVLVQGESGTGKELVAQAIHFHSHRARGPLITVNCAALTETLLESELFGHKKGAFTGAIQDRKGRFKLADGGTIILDEVGSMSLSGQAKLLRVLQEKEFEPVGESLTVSVDVRVIAITNADLVRAINEGRFREDLYYRLNAFPIHLPPLRERKVDIPLLARHFLKTYTISLKKQVEEIDLEAVSMLMDYSWPGNVRELENTVEYAVILEKGEVLKRSSLPDKLRYENVQNGSLKHRLELAEKQIILEALSKANWVKNQAANLLGIDRRNFSYFLNKHSIH
ncbi:sigma 54-interacting transcriptional regulator [Candidatus Poribacteria bacterium]|nr:sigma 54-interacting transcriptional regulator [Candidatus Poribacteria bacterium]